MSTATPRLDGDVPIVDPRTGRITPYFQRFWQNRFGRRIAYTAPTISNPPTQAEVQAIADAVQSLVERS